MSTAKKDKLTGNAIGTGRRKTAVVRVRVKAGSGTITVNDRPIDEYFLTVNDRKFVTSPIEAAGLTGQIDIAIRASGGGITGQAQACSMGVARALISHNPDLFPIMRDNKFLTRDSRMKERKKYGLRGARRGTQFSKR